LSMPARARTLGPPRARDQVSSRERRPRRVPDHPPPARPGREGAVRLLARGASGPCAGRPTHRHAHQQEGGVRMGVNTLSRPAHAPPRAPAPGPPRPATVPPPPRRRDRALRRRTKLRQLARVVDPPRHTTVRLTRTARTLRTRSHQTVRRLAVAHRANSAL